MNLQERAGWVRRETLKLHRRAPETRVASSLSSVEIFVSLYYGGVLRFNPANPMDPNRDRCVISKGHGSICMYPILANLGFFPEDELTRICSRGSFLGGIPDPVIPGYETINGSLGHGLGVASGMAFGLKTLGSDRCVFVISGDGELHEGANWEAIMFASQHCLDNLCLIVDNNQISMLGRTDDILSQRDLNRRLTSFGWDCSEVDGHDVAGITKSLLNTKNVGGGKPKALIANTLKGKGLPSLEDKPLSHVMNPSIDLLDEIISGFNS